MDRENVNGNGCDICKHITRSQIKLSHYVWVVSNGFLFYVTLVLTIRTLWSIKTSYVYSLFKSSKRNSCILIQKFFCSEAKVRIKNVGKNNNLKVKFKNTFLKNHNIKGLNIKLFVKTDLQGLRRINKYISFKRFLFKRFRVYFFVNKMITLKSLKCYRIFQDKSVYNSKT